MGNKKLFLGILQTIIRISASLTRAEDWDPSKADM